MPEEEQALIVGDVVEIIDVDNEDFALRGEIRELGPPLNIAFTFLQTFKLEQVKKVSSPSLLTWNELRARVKEAGIVAVGNREDLEASLNEHLEANKPAQELTRDLAATGDIDIGAIVQIVDPDDKLRHNCRGKVIDGPSFTVRLTNMNFDTEERLYAKNKLIRVG